MVYNFRNEENTGPIEELELEINLLWIIKKIDVELSQGFLHILYCALRVNCHLAVVLSTSYQTTPCLCCCCCWGNCWLLLVPGASWQISLHIVVTRNHQKGGSRTSITQYPSHGLGRWFHLVPHLPLRIWLPRARTKISGLPSLFLLFLSQGKHKGEIIEGTGRSNVVIANLRARTTKGLVIMHGQAWFSLTLTNMLFILKPLETLTLNKGNFYFRLYAILQWWMYSLALHAVTQPKFVAEGFGSLKPIMWCCVWSSSNRIGPGSANFSPKYWNLSNLILVRFFYFFGFSVFDKLFVVRWLVRRTLS